MTPQTWAEIRRLFHEAGEMEARAREAFVRQHAASPEVQHEVLSLLALDPEAEAAQFLSPTTVGGGHIPDAVVRLASGVRLGPFEIGDLIGAGGMGEVYRARDTRLDRSVAVKVLSPGLVDNPKARDRFEREARAVSKLSHPHICTLHDVGSAKVDGVEVRYLVMELIDGETLAARLARGALPLDQAIARASEIVDALAAAHAAGVVHRDLKPANIVLTRSGVKLLDFGLARLSPAALLVSPHVPDPSITQAGTIIGTVPYMSSEQVKGGEADERSDIFAFGAVFYEMVAGTRAFAAGSQAELMAAILERQPPPLSERQPLAPPALERLISICLAKAPGDRWQSAQDVRLALQGLTIASGGPPGATAAAARTSGSSGWRLHASWAAIASIVAAAAWSIAPAAQPAQTPANPAPVVFLMDSPLPGRVYDARTLAAGGTNADDISDALRGLPIAIYKENTSPMWHREDQVRQQRPDLIVSHLSGFADLRWAATGTELNEVLFALAQDRLKLFFAYQAATNARVRFLVYSRGRDWPTAAEEDAWIREVVARFPALEGRVHTMVVPGREKATFRDPATARALLVRVQQILAQPGSQP